LEDPSKRDDNVREIIKERIFNKRGDAVNIKIIEEEKEHVKKILADFYADLFKEAKKEIENQSKKEQKISKGVNEALKRLDELDKVEREFDIDIVNLMLEHYKDDTKYKYEFKNMFLICLLEALEKWSNERGLEKIKSMLKAKVDDDTYYVKPLAEMLRVAGSRYNQIEYENNGLKFKTNPEELIDEEVGDIALDESIRNHATTISERIYEELKIRGYLPDIPGVEIKDILANFSQIFIESLLGLKNTTFKVRVIAMASYYDAVMDKVAQFGNNNEVSEIYGDMLRVMMTNKISDEDRDESKRVLELLLKKVKRGNESENESKSLIYT